MKPQTGEDKESELFLRKREQLGKAEPIIHSLVSACCKQPHPGPQQHSADSLHVVPCVGGL